MCVLMYMYTVGMYSYNRIKLTLQIISVIWEYYSRGSLGGLHVITR